jgi:hypothetical protein
MAMAVKQKRIYKSISGEFLVCNHSQGNEKTKVAIGLLTTSNMAAMTSHATEEFPKYAEKIEKQSACMGKHTI